MKAEKAAVRLNEKALKIAAIENDLETNAQIADTIGISVSQLWRATLPVDDPRYNAPSSTFIAGVLHAFGEPFEKFFFLADDVAISYQTKEVQ
jgi:hypothetical protein